jgi:hypothetical protein
MAFRPLQVVDPEIEAPSLDSAEFMTTTGRRLQPATDCPATLSMSSLGVYLVLDCACVEQGVLIAR